MSDTILVLTGDPSLPDPTKPGQHYNPEDLENLAQLQKALGSLQRFHFEFFDAHQRLLERLAADPPALVLNFCDTGFFNLAAQELHVPALLELLGVPYSGAPPAAMAIAFDKQIVRLVAQAMGIATPHEIFLSSEAHEIVLPQSYPALIKPNQADGSLGITADAVVHSDREARAYIEWVRAELPGRALLLQEYLPGAEYGVGLVGNPGALEALPPLEVDYTDLPAGLAPILSYESKAFPDSPYWTQIRYRKAAAPPEVARAMVDAAERLFLRLGFRDYARFDFRCDAAGVPKLMEVNPNPAWSYDAKLAMMAGFAGVDYPALLTMIIEAALRRIGAGSEPAAPA